MAITSPRVIFACTIPTIIVILSYIWFKKKKELTQKSESNCSRSNRSTVSIRQEIQEAEKQSEERVSTSELQDTIPVADFVEVPFKEFVEVPFKDFVEVPFKEYEQVPVKEYDQVPVKEYEQVSVKEFVEVPVEELIEVPVEELIEVPVKEFVAFPVKEFVEVPVKEFIEIPVKEFVEEPKYIFSLLSVEQSGVEPESPQTVEPASTETVELAAPLQVDVHIIQENSSDKQQTVEMVSDTVAKNREKQKSCTSSTRVVTSSSEEKGSAVSPTKSVDTPPPHPSLPASSAIQTEKMNELIKRVEETHIVAKPNESSDAAVSSEENDSLSSQSNDTIVDDLDTTVVDINVTITSDKDLPSPPEERASKTELNNQPITNGHAPSSTEPESVLVSVNSIVAEHPTAVSSPGSVDESDVHKTTNGTDTSAYGSASHSPAEELLESPTVSNYSDMHSEAGVAVDAKSSLKGSSDSGKGCSDIHTLRAESSTTGFPLTPMSVFEFELPQELCGRLIGQKGRYVNYIKSKSRANISIKRHPFNADLKLCAVIGTEEDINAALVVIRKRFPLTRFPCISMVQVNAPLLSNVPIPDTLQLHLPEGVTCDVILSSLVSAGHFFIQQPTHPTYPSLGRLDQCMLHCYMNGMGAPELPKPVEAGVICAASTMGGWYRAQIVYVKADADECEVRFVDYGGYSQEAISSLRQIRSDFMTLPFQASECYLANVVPLDETLGWTLDATSLFEDMAQGQILQAQIVSYSEDGIPYIHLYRIQGVMTTFINRELVDCGVAKWVEHQA